ncbi:MAG TPA: PAS domain S-box protein [Longimicrobium sp.]|jgi:PAS domain S-box-containing protein
MIEPTPELPEIRVLLVEDDEDDFALTRDLLSGNEGTRFTLDWERSYAGGLKALREGGHDVVLLDYRLGERTGLEFLGALSQEAHAPPVILLTGQGDRATDLRAMQAGAADYLAKSGLSATMLERSIRYAVERRRADTARREAELRSQLLIESVGAIVWQGDPATLHFTFVSREAEHLLGYPIERWTQEPEFWVDHIHPEDRSWALAYCEDASRRGLAHSFEYRMIAADGRVVWLRDIVRVVETGGARTLAGVMVDITATRQAEEALRLRDRAMEAISEGILITDPHQPDGPIVYVNPAFEELTGYAAADVLGRNCRFLQGQDTDPAAVAGLRAAMAAGEPATVELVNYRSDGTPFWNHLSIGPVRDASGKLTHFVGVQQDVTGRRRAEEALRHSEQSYRSLFDSLKELVYIQDLQGHLLAVNEALLRRYGYTREEVIGNTPLLLADPEWSGAADALECFRRAAAGELQDFEWGARTRAGEVFVQDVSLSRGEYFGQPVVIAVGRDITERKRAETELAVAEAHYRRLVTTAPQAVYAIDAEGRFVELNPAGERLLGQTAAALRGRRFDCVIAPGDVAAADEVYARMASGEISSVEVELHVARPDGEERLVRIAATSICDGGAVTGAHGVARDITDERAREREVRLLAAALEGLREQGVSIFDEDGRFVYTNRTHARILGYDQADLGSLDLAAFTPDAQGERELREILERARQDGGWSGRISRRRLSDGEVIPLELSIGTVEEGGRTLFFVVSSDATEKIARERHLRRVERLAGVGTLIAGVAHELNNPLSAVLGFTRLLLMEPRPDSEREDLETIARETERMAKIVSDLRLIARGTQEESGKREPVDLNDVVRHVLKTRAYALRTGNVEVADDLAAGLPTLLADRGKLEQVLLNLVINAEQALAGVAGDRRLAVRTRPAAGGVSLQVSDNGPGIPPEHLDRIFDPFFTTKLPGEGTGLGLSLVHTIVSEHEGEIRVDSEPGKGTFIRVDLPAAPEPSEDAPAPEAPAGAVRPLRVLVVDDEAAVRKVVVRSLQRRGHTVDEAADGGRALQLLDAPGVVYDAIVSDLRMPGMSGDTLLSRLRERGGADRRLVFLTGDTASPDAMRILADAGVPVLPKPGGIVEVAGVVERLGALRRGA